MLASSVAGGAVRAVRADDIGDAAAVGGKEDRQRGGAAIETKDRPHQPIS